MLAILKNYLSELDSRLDLRILRTHEPVRAKTTLLGNNREMTRESTLRLAEVAVQNAKEKKGL